MCTGKRLRHNDKKEIGFKSRLDSIVCINVGLCPFLQFSPALSRKNMRENSKIHKPSLGSGPGRISGVLPGAGPPKCLQQLTKPPAALPIKKGLRQKPQPLLKRLSSPFPRFGRRIFNISCHISDGAGLDQCLARSIFMTAASNPALCSGVSIERTFIMWPYFAFMTSFSSPAI